MLGIGANRLNMRNTRALVVYYLERRLRKGAI
jgi:hypothetical protein